MSLPTHQPTQAPDAWLSCWDVLRDCMRSFARRASQPHTFARHRLNHNESHTWKAPPSNKLPEADTQRRVRVLLADDHTMFRQALRALLEQMRGLEVVGEAANGVQTVEMARQLRPDIVVMDISMPEMDGIEATRRITQEHTCRDVVGLSMHQAPEMADKMYAAGARTYLTKDQAMEQLMAAVRAFAQPHANP